MGKHKYIETPEKLKEIYDGYREHTKARKRIIQKATPRGVVEEEHTPPLSMSGFEVYCFDLGYTVEHYFRNTNGAYADYCGICSIIKKDIRQDQIEGGMVGQYNSSITQRLNGLTEKTDVTSGGESISEIKINVVRKGLFEDDED